MTYLFFVVIQKYQQYKKISHNGHLASTLGQDAHSMGILPQWHKINANQFIVNNLMHR